MKRETLAKRGAVFGALTAFTVGFVCLACVLPGIGAIIGISLLVTAVGGIAEDGALTVVGIMMLLVSIALGAYVLVARRRRRQDCIAEGLDLEVAIKPAANPTGAREGRV
jgi:hypothetical protein